MMANSQAALSTLHILLECGQVLPSINPFLHHTSTMFRFPDMDELRDHVDISICMFCTRLAHLTILL